MGVPGYLAAVGRSFLLRAGRFEVGAVTLASVTLGLRMVRLDAHSLWLDELFSVFWSAQELAFLWGDGRAAELNPPLYYTMLRAWSEAFGRDVVPLRLLSVLGSSVLTVLVAAIGWRLRGPGAGWLSGLLAALSPMLHNQGQEVRVYPWLLVAEALAILGMVSWLRNAQSLGRPDVGTRGLLPFAAFLAGCFLASQLHNTAFLLIASCFVVLGAASPVLPWLGGRALAALLAGAAMLLLLSAPQIGVAAAQSHTAGIAWIGPVTFHSAAGFFAENLAGIYSPVRSWGAAVAALAAAGAAAGAWSARRDPVALLVLAAMPAAFLLAIFSVSLHRPILLGRVGSVLLIPASVALAVAATSIPKAALRRSVVAAVLLAFAALLGYHEAEKDQLDWRPVASAVSDDPACSGPIFLGFAGLLLGLQYYRPALALRDVQLLSDRPDVPEDAFLKLVRRMRDLPVASGPAALGRAIDTGRGAVLLTRVVDPGKVDPIVEGFAHRAALSDVSPRNDAQVHCFPPVLR